ALKGSERPAEIQSIIRQVEDLYSSSLNSLEKVLKPTGVMVIVVPEFFIRGTSYKTDIEGYFEKHFEQTGHWVYARDDQMVVRHIYRLRKNG
ncbi:MAG: hypothetical protein AAB766_00520, partial [Patescibacteria group bacterium]